MKHLPLIGLACMQILCLGSCRNESEEIPAVQSADYRLVKLHYENSVGEQGVTHLYYDKKEQNYMAVWHLIDSSRSSINHYEFDSVGNMIVKSREFSDGLTSVQHYEYDMKGNLIHEDFSRLDRGYGEVDYKYDPDGRLQSADCRGLNGWFHGSIEYIWEDGIKIGADLKRDSVSIGSIVYEYEDGRLDLEFWEFYGDWNQTFRYEYQFAAQQSYTCSNVFIRESPWFRVSSEFYEFNGEPGGPSFYVYEQTGKLVSKEFKRSDGLSTITTYAYDTTGLLNTSLREYGDGRTTDFSYWYSVDRNLLLKTYQWSDSTSGAETYRYENGLLNYGEYVNMDGWLNGTFSYEYSDDDILNSAVFSGKDGFDAELNFKYDRNLNLTKIHWDFSSGDSQTYYYKYEPF